MSQRKANMAFTVRKIEQAGASFGQKLKALRRDRGMNVAQVASATYIHPQIISALEADQFHKLPEPIYTRNFLRNYVRYLGGDEHYFLQCFEDVRGTCDLVDPMLLPREKIRRTRFLVTPRIFKSILLVGAACLVLAYLGFEVRRILIPPMIEIAAPTDGLTTDSAMVTVKGKVFERAEVIVNGKKILTNKDGTFAADVDLDRGLNLITVSSKKRYSQTSTVYRRVVLDNQNQNIGISTVDKKLIP